MATLKTFNPGELRQRVTIQQKSVTRDAFGAETISWTDVATVWAKIWHLRGRELMDAQQAEADTSTQITIRYRAGILPTMRVVHGSAIYDIQAALDMGERHRFIELQCRSVI